jgi:thiol-disulfide isomerase/thioredoxin
MVRAVLMLTMVAIVAILAAGARAAEPCAPPAGAFKRYAPAAPGGVAPGIAFYDDAERERTFVDFRGRGLVVNFWATWCAPCVKEMPALDRLHADLAPDGIDVVALSADREGVPVVRRFYEANAIRNLGVFVDRRGAVARALSVQGLPTTILFSAAGREIGRVVGIADWEAPVTIDYLRRCLATLP